MPNNAGKRLRMKTTLTTRVLFLIPAMLLASGICHARSTHETIDHVQPRMVKIYGAGGLRGLAAYGTGFLVSKEGHIVTIWSHVLDPDEVVVVLNDGRRYFATVLGADPQLDLAVLQIQAPEEALDLPFFDVASESGEASAGTRVLGFSNMFKVATGDESVSVLHGVIAARTALRTRRGTFETPYNGEVYVVDAITNNSGAGGGLLTSRDGTLLGVIGRELRNADTNTWVNYSIPMSALQQAITEIINGEFRTREETLESTDDPRRYAALDFGIVMVPDVLFRTPAYIDSVIGKSPAGEAGLKPDDLVLFVGNELMQSIRQMKRALGRLQAGDRLRIVVRRGEELVTIELAAPRKPTAE
jgi:serine protease Do